jgi:hypothetical protein
MICSQWSAPISMGPETRKLARSLMQRNAGEPTVRTIGGETYQFAYLDGQLVMRRCISWLGVGSNPNLYHPTTPIQFHQHAPPPPPVPVPLPLPIQGTVVPKPVPVTTPHGGGTTTTPAPASPPPASNWGPVLVGLTALVGGVALGYAVTRPVKTSAQIVREARRRR